MVSILMVHYLVSSGAEPQYFYEDALVASIATFHSKKIIISDPTKFPHYGSIPDSMYRCVTAESRVMADYHKLTPKEPRVLSPEQQAVVDAVEKPGNRGKRITINKETTEEDQSKTSKSKKRKSEKGASFKPKKIKKMAKRSRIPTPPSSENQDDDEEEDIHQDSRRGNTPPRSPTPTESPHHKLPTPPPSPKLTVPVSVVPISAPATSQTTPPPPVSSISISTTTLTPHIISQSTTTTIP
ncbi:actin cytoskeleton-regulatory complex protein pan1-like [Lactuca sativa]|uniref:actin cytoskeleton-regulatory complex protein pan1-like n=1 Tax=Lactuca sativa TaxID=4236 RepID=UPI000CD8C084|nr:actin cytoskeleton-regulatory complex protein pan1-like [Lactuca sativa]